MVRLVYSSVLIYYCSHRQHDNWRVAYGNVMTLSRQLKGNEKIHDHLVYVQRINSKRFFLSRAALGRVCLKLVVVMGITWLADIISWAIGGSKYIWIATDCINALQGVLIFIVVGCQPQVWSAIKRFWTSKTGRLINTTTNGPQHSSSSHGLPSMGESITNNTFTNTSTKVPLETVC